MSIYDSLNEQQKEAVCHTEGPLLILAGAGSGKTRVLTHRIAYLIEEKGVNPWNILAITFTNKAAGEMRERVDSIVGFGAESIWVSTFHSMCVRILRRYIDRLGYDTNFTIYDADDQKTLMKDVCKYLKIDTKMLKERTILGAISSAKDEMVTPEEFALRAEGDYMQKKIAQAYTEYEKQLRANNALDFDDLLLKTVQLFQTQPDVLESYQERFRYIMVDEYQDTNTVQFMLVSILAGKYKNLCVVGDDDQSIYKFRGANIKNILNFEQVFPNTKVIKLEQNYRSTTTILDAANAVIRNNKGRKAKALWTQNGLGTPIQFRQFDTAFDEAEYIVNNIKNEVNSGKRSYHDFAVLYRTNAQSRMFEEKLVVSNVPYRIVGGINFYARREIKDLLAYLKTIDNGRDDLAVRRIINVPKRGIGLTTINRVQEYAAEREIGFYDALVGAHSIPAIGRSAGKLESFVALIEQLKAESANMSISKLMDELSRRFFLDGYGHDDFASLRAGFSIVGQELLVAESFVLFEFLWIEVVEGYHRTGILVEGHKVVVAHIACLLCRDDLLHHFYCGVALSCIFLLFGLDHHFGHHGRLGLETYVDALWFAYVDLLVVESETVEHERALAVAYTICARLSNPHLG